MPDGHKRLKWFRSDKQRDWYGFYRQNRWARRFMFKDMDIQKVCQEFKKK